MLRPRSSHVQSPGLFPQALKKYPHSTCSNFTIALGMSSMEECKPPKDISVNDGSEPSLKRRRLGNSSMESHELELSDHDSEESLEFEFDSDEEPQPPQPKSSKKRTVANVLSRDKLEESRAAIDKTGVIYLSKYHHECRQQKYGNFCLLSNHQYCGFSCPQSRRQYTPAE